MGARMIVELTGGGTVLFGGHGSGDRLAASGGLAEVGLGEDVARATSERFKAALGTLGDVIAVLEEQVGRLARRPDSIELEFRASLTATCDLWIVAGDGEAEFKVRLAWDKPAPPV